MLLTNQSVGQSAKHITLNKSIKGGGEESKIPVIKVLYSLFFPSSQFLFIVMVSYLHSLLCNSSLGCHAMSSPPKNEASFKREGLLNGIQKECCDSSLSKTIIIHQVFVTGGLKS